MTTRHAIKPRQISDHLLAVLVWLSAFMIAGFFLWLLADMVCQGMEPLSQNARVDAVVSHLY